MLCKVWYGGVVRWSGLVVCGAVFCGVVRCVCGVVCACVVWCVAVCGAVWCMPCCIDGTHIIPKAHSS